jgi:hypothetical protein
MAVALIAEQDLILGDDIGTKNTRKTLRNA